MDAITLKAGVTVRDLYADANLDETTLAKIEDLEKDGFTEDELTEIKDMGVDIEILKQNAKTDDKKTEVKAKTAEETKAKADEVRTKYCSNLENATGVDAYSSKNPELKALDKAMKDGLIKDLQAAGFSKAQITEIISTAFPTVGIKASEKGGYTLPYGHDTESKEIYNRFQELMFASTTGSTEDIKNAQAQIAKLNLEIRSNNLQLQELEMQVLDLERQIEAKMQDNIEQSHKIMVESKADAQEAVSRNLHDYTNAQGKISYEDFQANLTKDLNSIDNTAEHKLAEVVLQMITTERKMAALNVCLTKMDDLNIRNGQLKDEMAAAQKNLADALAKPSSSSPGESDPDSQRCDPIGWTDAAGNRYDLFIDKDDNKDITNEKEFLGAENGFEEMRALDAGNTKDGKVSMQEMAAAGVKVVVTKADGSQEIKDISAVMGENDYIDLGSYNEMNHEMDNGDLLVGTFDVSFGGQKAEGYQTLDKLENLDANFEFTDEVNHLGRHAVDEYDGVDTLDYGEFVKEHQAKLEEYEFDMDIAWANLQSNGQNIRGDLRDSLYEAKIEGKETDGKIREYQRRAEEKQEKLDKIAEAKKQKEEEDEKSGKLDEKRFADEPVPVDIKGTEPADDAGDDADAGEGADNADGVDNQNGADTGIGDGVDGQGEGIDPDDLDPDEI